MVSWHTFFKQKTGFASIIGKILIQNLKMPVTQNVVFAFPSSEPVA